MLHSVQRAQINTPKGKIPVFQQKGICQWLSSSSTEALFWSSMGKVSKVYAFFLQKFSLEIMFKIVVSCS